MTRAEELARQSKNFQAEMEAGDESAGVTIAQEQAPDNAKTGETGGEGTKKVSEKEKLIELQAEVRKPGQEYANTRADFEEKRKWWKKVLGLGVEKNEDVAAARQKWQESLDKFKDASLEGIFSKFKDVKDDAGKAQFEKEVEILTRKIKAEEAVFVGGKTRDRVAENMEKRGWISKNVVGGYNKMVENFRKLDPRVRIPIMLAMGGAGAALALTGVVGLGFGSVGAAAMSGFKIGRRLFGGSLAAKGAEEFLEAKAEKYREKKLDEDVARVLSVLNEQGKDHDQKLALIKTELSGKKVGEHIVKMRKWEAARKAFARTFGTSITAFGMAMEIKQTFAGAAGAAKEISRGAAVAPEDIKKVPAAGFYEPAHSPIPDAGKYGPPIVEGQPPSASTTGAGDIIRQAQESPAAGAKVNVPSELNKSDLPPVPEKAALEKIASMKIPQGGTLWGSIEQNIRANPAAYGLDPNDPDFVKDARKMTRQMLDEFASRKGLTYEQLDRVARLKVRPGDGLKMIYNPATEEFHIEYEGRAFGADVGGETPVAEEARTGTSVGREAEHPSQRPVSQQAGGMEEIEARQKLAQQKYDRAVQAEQDWQVRRERLAGLNEAVGHEAQMRQVLATRGLLNRVIEGSGIGNNISFWEGDASRWHAQIIGKELYIPQDVQLAGETEKLNLNLDKLKKLFSILAKQGIQPGESNGDCLMRAMKDPKNVVLINRLVLGK
jgi:hypothetical protein